MFFVVVAALLDHGVPRTPLPLKKDGDLLAIIHSVFCLRRSDTVKVSKVKGHATPAMVAHGDVRVEDLIGNDGADAAADLGRLRQDDEVNVARRDLLRVRRSWYPIMLDLHRFMVAISRIEVNHDGSGGTAPDAMVWDKGGTFKTRAGPSRLIIDCASLPGPPDFWDSSWVALNPLPVSPDDVVAWPYSVDILLVFSSFLASSLASGRKSMLELDFRLKRLFDPTNGLEDLLFFLVFSYWFRARNPTWLSVSP